MSLLILVITLAVHHFIERPFRGNGKVFLFAGSAALFIFALGPFGVKLQEQSYPAKEMLLFKAWGDRAGYRCEKISDL